MKQSTRGNPVIFVLFLLTVAAILGGCELIEHAARDTKYVLTGSPSTRPTTKPSDALQAAQHTVEVIKYIFPPIEPYLSILGGFATGIAGIAAALKTKRRASGAITAARGALSEVVDDLIHPHASFIDSTEPWTEQTRKLLEQLGHFNVARTTEKAS